jgi:carbon-monoxide dehydrogenase small subunit
VAVSEAGVRLRDAFVASGAVQCGFCTPGLMVQASHVIERHPGADEAAIRRGIEGNLCRCTGYRKIIDAIAATARAASEGVKHGRS